MTECVDRAAMAELIADATTKAEKFDVDMPTRSQSLKATGALQAAARAHVPHQAKRVLTGWQVILSLCIYSDGLHHWHGSAMLWPEGRCSTDQDWKNLGLIVALSGAPESVNEQIHAQVRDVHPNRPHHWIWFVPARVEA